MYPGKYCFRSSVLYIEGDQGLFLNLSRSIFISFERNVSHLLSIIFQLVKSDFQSNVSFSVKPGKRRTNRHTNISVFI